MNIYRFATICIGFTLSMTPISFVHAIRYEVYAAQLQNVSKAPVVTSKKTTRTPTSSSPRRRTTNQSRTTATILSTQPASTVQVHTVISAVNDIRNAKNVAPLILHDGLTTVAKKQLERNVTVFDQTALEKVLDEEKISFRISAEECNCAGTSNTYRQIVLKKQNTAQVITKIQNEYRAIFLMDSYQYIGMYELNGTINIILGGSKDIAFTPFSDSQIQTFRSEILQLVNKERTFANLPQVTMNQKLERSAQAYALRMWNERFYAHISPDGKTLEDRVSAEQYFDVDLKNCDCKSAQFYIGENIAKGQKTANEVMQDWMNSPGHRKNILSPDFTEIGIGIYGNRWVQNFGTTKLVR